MILKYKLFILVLLLVASMYGFKGNQRDFPCLKDIYGDAVSIAPGDSIVILVYTAPITCTGCKKLLVQYFKSLSLNHAQVVFIYNGRGDIVHKKRHLDETRQWIKHSECYFFYANLCAHEDQVCNLLLADCERSPCLGVMRDGQFHVFNSGQMFFESENGALQFKESFLRDFEKLL